VALQSTTGNAIMLGDDTNDDRTASSWSDGYKGSNSLPLNAASSTGELCGSDSAGIISRSGNTFVDAQHSDNLYDHDRSRAFSYDGVTTSSVAEVISGVVDTVTDCGMHHVISTENDKHVEDFSLASYHDTDLSQGENTQARQGITYGMVVSKKWDETESSWLDGYLGNCPLPINSSAAVSISSNYGASDLLPPMGVSSVDTEQPDIAADNECSHADRPFSVTASSGFEANSTFVGTVNIHSMHNDISTENDDSFEEHSWGLDQDTTDISQAVEGQSTKGNAIGMVDGMNEDETESSWSDGYREIPPFHFSPGISTGIGSNPHSPGDLMPSLEDSYFLTHTPRIVNGQDLIFSGDSHAATSLLPIDDCCKGIDTVTGGDTPNNASISNINSFEERSWGFDEHSAVVTMEKDGQAIHCNTIATGDNESERSWSDSYGRSDRSRTATIQSHISSGASHEYRQGIHHDKKQSDITDGLSSLPSVIQKSTLACGEVIAKGTHTASHDSVKSLDSFIQESENNANIEPTLIQSISNESASRVDNVSVRSDQTESSNKDSLPESDGSRYDRSVHSVSYQDGDLSVDSAGKTFSRSSTGTGDQSSRSDSYGSDEHSVDVNGDHRQRRSLVTSDRSNVSTSSSRSDDRDGSVDTSSDMSQEDTDERSPHSESDQSDDRSLDSGGAPLPRRQVGPDDRSYTSSGSYRSNGHSVDSNDQSYSSRQEVSDDYCSYIQSFHSRDHTMASNGSPRKVQSDSENLSYDSASNPSEAQSVDSNGNPVTRRRASTNDDSYISGSYVSDDQSPEPLAQTRITTQSERSYDSCSYQSDTLPVVDMQDESYHSYFNSDSRYSASVSHHSVVDEESSNHLLEGESKSTTREADGTILNCVISPTVANDTSNTGCR